MSVRRGWRRSRGWVVAGAVFLSIWALPPFVAPAPADTESATLTVTVEVVERARITAVGDIEFSAYDPTATEPADASGWVEVRTTQGLDYTVYIDGRRALESDGQSLQYDLYTDPARSTPWGSDVATGVGFTGDVDGLTRHDIHARIEPGRDVPAGLYTDTVTVTVEW